MYYILSNDFGLILPLHYMLIIPEDSQGKYKSVCFFIEDLRDKSKIENLASHKMLKFIFKNMHGKIQCRLFCSF